MRRSLRLASKVAKEAATGGVHAVADASGVVTSHRAAQSALDTSGKTQKRERLVKLEAADTTRCITQEAMKEGSEAPYSTADGWTALCSARELSCALTLASGQVFSWRKRPAGDAQGGVEWVGVVGRRVYALREQSASVECRCLFPSDVSTCEMVSELTHYFRLEASTMTAAALVEGWTQTDDRMARVIKTLPGLRLVRQDPVECLFSFICSSNNHIQRIQQMVDKLRAAYGDLLFTCSATAQRFHAFPSVDALARKCEDAALRELGFGYRAPFVLKTARQLQALGGETYLLGLRDDGVKAQRLPPGSVEFDGSYQDELMVFAGVGRKVADCVALFSLERLDAIPVDTHVWQIACREFDASLAGKKSLTPRVYQSVGDRFRARFAPFAGWAHSVLFAGDLTAFRPLLADVDGGVGAASKAKKRGAVPSEASEPRRKKKAAGEAKASRPSA